MAKIITIGSAKSAAGRLRKTSMHAWRITEVVKLRSFDVEEYRLHRSLRRREAEVCNLVDDCQAALQRRIHAFFRTKRTKIAKVVDDFLAGRKASLTVSLGAAVLSQAEMDNLVSELKALAENKVSPFFGVQPLLCFPAPSFDQGLCLIARLGADYQTSLGTMRLVAIAAGLSVEKSVESLKMPFPANRLLEELDIGAAFLRMVNCWPQQHYLRYREELIGQITGLLQAVEAQLAANICVNAAKSCYELHDLIEELRHEQALVRLRARRRAQRVSQEGVRPAGSRVTA